MQNNENPQDVEVNVQQLLNATFALVTNMNAVIERLKDVVELPMMPPTNGPWSKEAWATWLKMSDSGIDKLMARHEVPAVKPGKEYFYHRDDLVNRTFGRGNDETEAEDESTKSTH